MMVDQKRPPASYPEEVRDAFEYCNDCGVLTVSVDAHSCSDGESAGRPSARERARLGKLDPRPGGEDVLYPEGRSSNNAWAYHELGEDGDPLHELDHQGGAVIGPREEAIDHGCYPCGKCTLILESRGEQ